MISLAVYFAVNVISEVNLEPNSNFSVPKYQASKSNPSFSGTSANAVIVSNAVNCFGAIVVPPSVSNVIV